MKVDRGKLGDYWRSNFSNIQGSSLRWQGVNVWYEIFDGNEQHISRGRFDLHLSSKELDALLVFAPKDLGFATLHQYIQGPLKNFGVHAMELCVVFSHLWFSAVAFHADAPCDAVISP